MIYLDNASTTQPLNEVITEMVRFYNTFYGNPSSKHKFGNEIKRHIESARSKAASVLNCNPSEIFFNSGATEGINTAIRGYVEANSDKGQHVITTKVEHKAVLNTFKYLEDLGIEVSYLDVDENGQIDIEELQNTIKADTILFATLWVNNETGVLQDISNISELLKGKNIAFFVDATQAVGKLPIDISELDVDMMCFSAHKIHGPKGIGGLFIKEGIKITPLLYGGEQEGGKRSGTYNVPGIMGMAKAFELVDLKDDKIKKVNGYLESKLKDEFKCIVVGGNSKRSGYISNVIFPGIDADSIVNRLDETMISTGSACTSRIVEPSHVLKCMGYDDELCFSALRFSISRFTTFNDIDVAIAELRDLLKGAHE